MDEIPALKSDPEVSDLVRPRLAEYCVQMSMSSERVAG